MKINDNKVGIFDALKAVSYGTTATVIKATEVVVGSLHTVEDIIGMVGDTVTSSRKVVGFGLTTWEDEAHAEYIVAKEEAETAIYEARKRAQIIQNDRTSAVVTEAATSAESTT